MRTIACCLILAASAPAHEGTVSFDPRTDTESGFEWGTVIAGFLVCLVLMAFRVVFCRRAATDTPVSLGIAEPCSFDAAHAAGVIGIADDLPSDLSTNPEHFEGFGESWINASRGNQ